MAEREFQQREKNYYGRHRIGSLESHDPSSLEGTLHTKKKKNDIVLLIFLFIFQTLNIFLDIFSETKSLKYMFNFKSIMYQKVYYILSMNN